MLDIISKITYHEYVNKVILRLILFEFIFRSDKYSSVIIEPDFHFLYMEFMYNLKYMYIIITKQYSSLPGKMMKRMFYLSPR
jgi:hypothetical protein